MCAFPYLLSVMITVLVGVVTVSVELVGRERERRGVVAGRVGINHYKAYLNRMHFLAGTALHR